jgi:hypothetical protein
VVVDELALKASLIRYPPETAGLPVPRSAGTARGDDQTARRSIERKALTNPEILDQLEA